MTSTSRLSCGHWRSIRSAPIAPRNTSRHPLPRRVRHRLRVLPHVPIRIDPLRVALLRIHREEQAHHRIIPPRMILIQPRERIGFLPGERFGGTRRADRVARGAIRRVKLLPGERSGRETGQQAALVSGREEEEIVLMERTKPLFSLSDFYSSCWL